LVKVCEKCKKLEIEMSKDLENMELKWAKLGELESQAPDVGWKHQDLIHCWIWVQSCFGHYRALCDLFGDKDG